MPDSREGEDPMDCVPGWSDERCTILAGTGSQGGSTGGYRESYDAESQKDRTLRHRHLSGENWETFGLRMCDVILFWIPPQAREMRSHRIYAITTRLEMAENLARGHKVIIGVHPECEDLAGLHHLMNMARYYGVKKIHSTLEDCMQELKAWMEQPRTEDERVHHIAGPGFESMGVLSRVPQPNTNRNQTLMEHWNQQIHPGDTVYVEGEFGCEDWKPFLNGQIVMKEK